MNIVSQVSQIAAFAASLITRLDEVTASFQEALVVNPIYALESNGSALAHAGYKAKIGYTFKKITDQEIDEEQVVEQVRQQIERLEDGLLRGYFAPNSTSSWSNVMSTAEYQVAGEVVRWFRDLEREAGHMSIWEARAKAAANAMASGLGTVDGQTVTLGDFLAMRRQLREAELKLMGIMDLIALVKETDGLRYTGQPKAELIQLVMDKEFAAQNQAETMAETVTPDEAPAVEFVDPAIHWDETTQTPKDPDQDEDEATFRAGLEAMNVDGLKELARSAELEFTSKTKKADLVNLIVASRF